MRTLCIASVVLVCSRISLAQSADIAENNAASWTAFAPVDNATRSVTNSSERVKVGTSSILFTTASGFDTGVKYPLTTNWDFNASTYNFLTFWEYPENNTPIGWQGNQPIIVIRTGTGVITLTPSSQLTPNFAWKLFKVPLSGGYGWTRTQTGTPNLADIDQIEIHHDTWDAGFRIWIDGVQFRSLDPNGLPPAGPPPPAGVDPDVIESKVLLYIFDPIMENFAGQRLHQVYGWQSPQQLTTSVMQDFLASSHGRARFQIVETVLADEHPRFVDGFRHTDESFATAWAAHDFHNSTFDYVGFAQEHNLPSRVDAGEFDEVWVYAPPIGGMWESAMAGQGAYWVNGPTYPAAGGSKAYVIMGWNYERGVGEAIHSFGHRSESIMERMYGQWCQTSRCNTWSRFALVDQNAPGLGGVGNVHFPVNGQSDYDYANTRFVQSNADAWLNYPNLNDNTRSFNFHEWSPNNVDSQREYLNWWYSHMPHVSGRAPDFYLGNWWRYLLDVNQFKASGGTNLQFTIGIPIVGAANITNAQIVTGTFSFRADAEVDGALGRVDLYIDGQYIASDYIAPFTFAWDSTSVSSGDHAVDFKAYELQNGTESISAITTIRIRNCDSIDFNNDASLFDPQDIEALLSVYSEGPCVPTAAHCNDIDFNNDSSLFDPCDIDAFLLVFSEGPCTLCGQ